MNNRLIKMIGLSGTVHILEYLIEHKKTHYTDLLETKVAHTLNVSTDNKTDVFKQMVKTFMELVWKAEQYDRIAQDGLAHEILKRYNNKDFKACTKEEF